MPSEASSKPHDDVRRILAILSRLTRDAKTMPPTARRELMKKADVWLDEFNRVKGR